MRIQKSTSFFSSAGNGMLSMLAAAVSGSTASRVAAMVNSALQIGLARRITALRNPWWKRYKETIWQTPLCELCSNARFTLDTQCAGAVLHGVERWENKRDQMPTCGVAAGPSAVDAGHVIACSRQRRASQCP